MENKHLPSFTSVVQWTEPGVLRQSCAGGPPPAGLSLYASAPGEAEETGRGPPALGTFPKSPLWA